MGIPASVQAAADKADEIINQNTDDSGEIQVPVDEMLVGTVFDPAYDSKTDSNGQTDNQGENLFPQQENGSNDELFQSMERLNKSLDNENRHLKIRCADLERQLREVQDKEETSYQNQGDPDTCLTEEELEQLAAEGISPAMAKILTKKSGGNPRELEEIKQKLETVEKETERQQRVRFYSDVDRGAPGWRDINVKPDFLKWLTGLVPFQTYTFQELMDHSAGKNDSATVIKIFQQYAGAQPTPARKKTLDDLVEPSSRRTEAPSTGNQQWNQAQVKEFYNSLRLNPLKYTPAQIAAIEQKYIYGG